MNVHMTDSMISEIGSEMSQPWPVDVLLYQSLRDQQILLDELAESESIQAFLNMFSLSYRIEMRSNVEQMSPTGQLPFLKVGSSLVTGFASVVEFVNKKFPLRTLSSKLDGSQLADHKITMEMVANVFPPAESYLCWVHDVTLERYTRVRYFFPFPWPLNIILCWQKQRQVYKNLTASEWNKKSYEDVLDEVDSCCQALSEKLENQSFLYGDKPTELDAMVYGHVNAILKAPLPDPELKETVSRYKPLLKHQELVQERFFR